MFDLEAQIKQWREELARTGLNAGEVVDELEAHLREQFARMKSADIGDAEKFQITVARLGDAKTLKREFSKSRWRRIWGRRDNPVELKFMAGWFILMGFSTMWLLPWTIRMGFAIPPQPWPKLSLSTALNLLGFNLFYALQMPIGFGLLHRRKFWRVLAVGWTAIFLFSFIRSLIPPAPFQYGMLLFIETTVKGSHWIFFGMPLPMTAIPVVGMVNITVVLWGLFLLTMSPVKNLFRRASVE